MTIKFRPGIRIRPGIRARVPLPPVAYTVTPMVYNVDEGIGLPFYVTTLGVPDGTTLYWTVENITTINADFVATSGTVTINSGAGSFTVTPAGDLTTEGAETFTAQLRTGSTSGTIVASSASITVNDTSLTPPVPSSGLFNQPQNDYLSVAQPSYTALGSAGNHAYLGNISSGNIFKGSYPQPQVGWILIGNSAVGPYQVTLTGVTDGGATWNLTWASQYANNLYMDENYTLYDPASAPFNLGTTWTVEFSLYMNTSSVGGNQQGGIWGLLNQGGWATLDSINVALSGGFLQVNRGNNTAYNNIIIGEPVPQQWVHVAIVNNNGTQKVFYNGIQQVEITGSGVPNSSGTASWTNSTTTLYIGSLTGGCGFDGKLTNLRITDTAEYTSNFTPTLLPVNIPGHTRLLWTPSDQALATDTSDSPHVITNNGVTVDASYPASNDLNGSAVFGSSSYMQIGPAGSTPWALGTTWTIEWWQKSTNATTVSGLYTIMGQQAGDTMIDIYYQNGYLHAGNNRQICAEPPVGQWVHVAMVTSNGSVKVYYNGVAQTVNAMNYNLQNSALALYIGCRGNNLFQNFIGKLTNIRITDTEVYAGNFTPDVLPAVIADHTKLLYTPTVDTMYKLAAGGLAIGTKQIAFNSDYPQVVSGGIITAIVSGNAGLYTINYTMVPDNTVSSIVVKDGSQQGGAISAVGTTIYYTSPCYRDGYNDITKLYEGSELDNMSLYFIGNFGKTIVPVSITITSWN